jgi:cyclopropane fatty-acyl-phospholipid synthase-like methyltransferase
MLAIKCFNLPFGKRIPDNQYSPGYIDEKNYNGSSPDSFILSTLDKSFPEKQQRLNILDIGAGDGRNCVPIAIQNPDSQVTAFEICQAGCDVIRNKADENSLTNLKIEHNNILDDVPEPNPELLQENLFNKFNFAFMAHIVQHFNIDDIGKTFGNIYKMLSNNGILVFDSIVSPADLSDSDKQKNEHNGKSVFKEAEIAKEATDNGFDVVEIAPFGELYRNQAKFVKAWVNYDDKELKWFVLKKKTKT